MAVTDTKVDYYEVLGLSSDAGEEEVRAAYKKLALKWHPDRHNAHPDEAKEKFIEINAAYKALLDRRNRRPRRDNSRDLKSDVTPSSSSIPTPNQPSDASTSSTKSTTSELRTKVTCETKESAQTTTSEPQTKFAKDTKDDVKSGTSGRTRKDSREKNHYPRAHSPSINSKIGARRSRSRTRTDSHRQRDRSHSSHQRASSKQPKLATEMDDYQYVDLSPPIAPLLSPKSPHSASKDWIFPLPISLADLHHGASHHYRITRTLRTGKAQSVQVNLAIAPGWRKGTRVRVAGVGNERRDGTFQDIVFVVEEAPDAQFRRVDDDLEMSVQVPWAERPARPYSGQGPGGEVKEETVYVRGLNGEEYVLPIPRTLVEGADGSRVVGAGMPVRERGKVVGKGDLVIRWEFIFPETEIVQQSRWQSLRKAMPWSH